MKTVAEMTELEIQAALESIFDCTKYEEELQSQSSSINAELALLQHLKIAYNLIDRGTD